MSVDECEKPCECNRFRLDETLAQGSANSGDEKIADCLVSRAEEASKLRIRVIALEAAIMAFCNWAETLPMPVHPSVAGLLRIGRQIASQSDRPETSGGEKP
jgi:hypothetical protein